MTDSTQALYKPHQASTPLEHLRNIVSMLGSQTAAAEHIGVGRQHLSDLLNGRRGISTAVARKLGFRKRIVFEAVKR